ncbi:MAG: phosphopantetheine adenylyltransferase [Pseudomonadota bacterium]
MLQPILWLILASIHAIPALALFRPATLTALYGVAADSSLFLLMQHRAALFLAVFIACVWAAFVPEGRRLAVLVVSISMVSFLVLYWQSGSPAPLQRIALVDLAGLPVLVGVAWLAFRS